jgi:hypothetical protein
VPEAGTGPVHVHRCLGVSSAGAADRSGRESGYGFGRSAHCRTVSRYGRFVDISGMVANEPSFVGQQRLELVNALLADFDQVCQSGTPRWWSLEGQGPSLQGQASGSGVLRRGRWEHVSTGRDEQPPPRSITRLRADLMATWTHPAQPARGRPDITDGNVATVPSPASDPVGPDRGLTSLLALQVGSWAATRAAVSLRQWGAIVR